jgi:hypothetical protein
VQVDDEIESLAGRSRSVRGDESSSRKCRMRFCISQVEICCVFLENPDVFRETLAEDGKLAVDAD